MTQSQTKICQNCKNQFTIDPDDFGFYAKISVPPPTWCPECRMVRRFSFSNVFNLYRRACSKCGISMISMYSPDKEMIVYCMPCWWADDWDGLEYGADYDPSRPFLEQLMELHRRTPYQAMESAYLTNVKSDYCNALGHCKNSYLIFWADYCENAHYGTFLNNLKDSLDCYRMKDSELCYEDIGCNKCYRTFFSQECDSCSDVWFSRSLSGCVNCFGCINLRNKSYCIFNEQYTKEEYFAKLREFRLDSRCRLEEMKARVAAFWERHPRRSYIGNSLNVNVSGDYIYESKNARDVYMVSEVEDSRYVQFVSVGPARDCYDYSGWGNGAQLIYEAATVGEGVSNVRFSGECWPDALNVEYSFYAIACKNVFGCVNLKRKQYCILNKEYSKEAYEGLVERIKEDMMKNPYRDALGRTWRYGEFLPIAMSNFCYNESLADFISPREKDAAIAQGYAWYEGEAPRYAATMKGADVPDAIKQTEASILKETIACARCGQAFRFVPSELDLMRKLDMPLPDACYKCRQSARFAQANKPMIYDRRCAKCEAPIKTSYAPGRPERIYCEACYQDAIL